MFTRIRGKDGTSGVGFPALERLQSSRSIFDRLKIYNHINGVLPNDASDDATVKATDVLCRQCSVHRKPPKFLTVNSIDRIFSVLKHMLSSQ